MPELPEVETVVRTLAPHVLGRRITGATLLRRQSLHPLSLPLERLRGLVITGARRRGKLVLLALAPDADSERPSLILPSLLVVHLRMTGRLLPRSAEAEAGPHTRLILGLAAPDGEVRRLFFDDTRAFGQVFAATPGLLGQWRFWRELGPEPLELTRAGFSRRLAGRRAIKAALLDQHVIAGIGNIYADEALHAAGINPKQSAQTLTAEQRGRLLDALKAVLRLSIAQCGSSIRDYRDADGNVGAFQNSFAVYGRAGLPCRACGRPLEKCRVAGRATVFCSRCQPV